MVQTLTNDDFVITDEMINYRHANSINPSDKAAYGEVMEWNGLKIKVACFMKKTLLQK